MRAWKRDVFSGAAELSLGAGEAAPASTVGAALAPV
jgi:ribosomal protein L11